jgi:RNA polymerase sigma-70 factor (ECF subfamily)
VYDGPENDADVLRASVADPARFEALFDRHFGAIFRYVGRRLGRQAAEDVAAEVFLRAFESRARYDLSCANARPWLFGIAANLMRRSRRTEERRLRAFARQPAEPAAAPDDADGRLDSLDWQATRPHLARALERLRADEREVLLLVAWADLTYDEVAEALSIPVGTVRSRLHRARVRMARDLEPEQMGATRDEGGAGVAGGEHEPPGTRDSRDAYTKRGVQGARDIHEAPIRRGKPEVNGTHMTAPYPVAVKEDLRWTTSI